MLLRCFPLHLAKASTLVTVRPTIVPIFVPWVFPLFPWKPPCKCFPQLFGRSPGRLWGGIGPIDQTHDFAVLGPTTPIRQYTNFGVRSARTESNCCSHWQEWIKLSVSMVIPQEGFQWNLMQSTRIRKWNKQNLFNWKNHTTTVHCQIDSYYAQYWTKTILIHNVVDS